MLVLLRRQGRRGTRILDFGSYNFFLRTAGTTEDLPEATEALHLSLEWTGPPQPPLQASRNKKDTFPVEE